MNYQIYGVSFRMFKDLQLAIGYKTPMAITQINKQYGGIEQLIKNKLGLEDETEIKKKLQELRDQYYAGSTVPIKSNVLQFLQASNKLLSNTQKESLYTAIATATGTDIEQLKEDVKDFLKL